MKIKFIDKNTSLVKKIRKAIKYLPFDGISVHEGDIFEQEGVIVSASNPDFTFGGGLDALIAQKYPNECTLAQKSKEQQQIRNVLFTVTVDKDLKANRETVGQALSFAFNERNHMAPDQTILVSGLGTGIGGLDEDDFVWLFLKAVSEAHGYGWGIKYVKKDSTDFRTGKVTYKPGVWLEVLEAVKNGRECDIGLHIGKSFAGSGNYHIPEKIYFCIFKKEDVCGEGKDKIRVSKLLPLVELPQWLGYGPNGKKVVKKIGKKVDPEKYNPYQATKLPTIHEIKETGLRAQVRDQVRDQVWAQVGAQVWDQVGAQVRAQVGAQVWAQVRAQVGDQVWAQVRDQVWVTSYWAIGIHFDLGISHWFANLLKLGIMVIFVEGKIKVFGKKGKYLGEYDEKELLD